MTYNISISHIGYWFIIFLFWNTYHLLDKVMSWLHEIFSSWAYAYVHDSTCMRWTNGLYAVIYASASQPTLVLDLSSRHSDNLSFFIKWYVIKLIIPNIIKLHQTFYEYALKWSDASFHISILYTIKVIFTSNVRWDTLVTQFHIIIVFLIFKVRREAQQFLGK